MSTVPDPSPQHDPVAPRIGFRPHPALPWLLLAEGVPLQILIDPAPVRVPNTRPWFRGVVSQRGNILPVFDLGLWAGLPPEDQAPALLVAIGSGAHACAVRCSTTPGLLQVAADPALPPAAGFGPLDGYLHGGGNSAMGHAYEFDLARWLATETSGIAASAAGAGLRGQA